MTDGGHNIIQPVFDVRKKSFLGPISLGSLIVAF